jgi:hypothetical protein
MKTLKILSLSIALILAILAIATPAKAESPAPLPTRIFMPLVASAAPLSCQLSQPARGVLTLTCNHNVSNPNGAPLGSFQAQINERTGSFLIEGCLPFTPCEFTPPNIDYTFNGSNIITFTYTDDLNSPAPLGPGEFHTYTSPLGGVSMWGILREFTGG